ncbi:hypothetical protein EV401DRAFT_1895744 [Pisolithus croceorrhizus]|nr:hypothetical protein EV401DRAFT_1895744 [Pisolithus croceorrhizus]
MTIPDGFSYMAPQLSRSVLDCMSDRAVVNLLLMQTYVYYMHYSEDTFAIKLLVAAIWIVDTLHVSFDHKLRHFDKFGLYYLASVLMNDLAILQIFMVSAIQWWVAICCNPVPINGILSPSIEVVCDCPNYVIRTGSVWVWHWNTDISGQYYDVTPAWAIIAVAEVLITASLCVVFYSSSSGPMFSRTKRLLNTLIIYAVNRCLLTSLVAVADLVVTNEVKNTWTVGLDFILGQLYANSFLASLNSREHLRSGAAGTPSDLRISTIRFADPPEPPRDVERSKDGTNQSDVHKVAVSDYIRNALSLRLAKGILYVPVPSSDSLTACWRVPHQAMGETFLFTPLFDAISEVRMAT